MNKIFVGARIPHSMFRSLHISSRHQAMRMLPPIVCPPRNQISTTSSAASCELCALLGLTADAAGSLFTSSAIVALLLRGSAHQILGLIAVVHGVPELKELPL